MHWKRIKIFLLNNQSIFFQFNTSDYSDWMVESFEKTDIKPEQIVRVKKMKTKL